jgi:cell division protein FtsQ
MKRINWKYILKQTSWILLGIGIVVLLGAAMQKKQQKICRDITIEIKGSEKEMFIDEKDILQVINANGNTHTKKLSEIDLKALETALEKNLWIAKAELFFDNQQILHITIIEREPIARVFTIDGDSFYVDSNAIRLPLSEKLSARVPVFTNFSSNKENLSSPDSNTLKNIVALGKYIVKDSFWMAQIAQVYITPQATFEMISTIGNETIVFGNAEDIDEKFGKIYSFYKQVWQQKGISAYAKLYVQFKEQIVAIKAGADKQGIDTFKTYALLSNLSGARKNSTVDTAYKASLSIKSNNKNLIDKQQNKIINKTLSSNRDGVQAAPNQHQPKAIMKKL